MILIKSEPWACLNQEPVTASRDPGNVGLWGLSGCPGTQGHSWAGSNGTLSVLWPVTPFPSLYPPSLAPQRPWVALLRALLK